MARTRTKYVDFQTLLARGSSANTVIKLMMACNDLLLANHSLAEWKKELPGNMKSKQVGAKLYFVKLQLGHLFEGLKLIEEINKDPTLKALVDCGNTESDTRTKQLFRELEQFLPKAVKRKEFEELVGGIRHNLTFHYSQSGTLIERAISDRANRSDAEISSVTQGDEAHLWHFKVADDIVDSIITRQIWNISRKADARIEADKKLDRAFEIAMWFLDFSGAFIFKYLEN